MSESDRAEITEAIREYKTSDDIGKCFAEQALRNLLRSRVVEYRGKLYLSRCGELLVVELADVVRVEDQPPIFRWSG